MVVTSENPERENRKKFCEGHIPACWSRRGGTIHRIHVKSESESCSLVSLFETLSCVRFFCDLEFSRPEYWSGLPFRYPGNLPNPGINWGPPALQAYSLPAELPGKPNSYSKCTEFLPCDSGILFTFKYMNNFSNQGRRFNLTFSSRLSVFTSVEFLSMQFFLLLGQVFSSFIAK